MEKSKIQQGNFILRSAGNRLNHCLATAGALVLFAVSGSADVPRGVFSLFSAGHKASDLVLGNPDMTGTTVRQDWGALEPTEGNFDWEFLDGEVARAATAGKLVLLRINTQSGKPAWVTEAVEAAGGTFFIYDDDGTAVTIPVFWEPTFLAKKTTMIRALGAHFSANKTVAVVAASFANANSEDWNVPHTASEILDWLAAGYTTEKLLDAGKQIIDATMEAFPNQLVTIAVGGNGHVGSGGINLDPTATYVAANVVTAARTSWPGRLIVQINSLSTFNPVVPGPDDSAWNLLWNSQPDVAAQMLYWCYDESTNRVNNGVPGDPAEVLTKSIDSAVSYGTNFIEIYQKDVLNLPSVIAYARNRLGPAGLLNVSTRLQVGADERVAICGFIVGGSGTKRLLLRAIGPSLEDGGIATSLADPFLELHDESGAIIATNDDWEKTNLGGVVMDVQQDAIRGTGIPRPTLRKRP
ncbi:MAG: beta-galactosidase [Verrucomicrobiota bacterium]|nr:beta-galactosidase [Verrucomicrobiota bacterium]